MGQRAGFDWARLTMGQKGILITGAALFINMLIPWWNSLEFQRIEIPGGSVTGFNTAFGVLAGLLVIAVVVWEIVTITGVANLQAPVALVSAALAGGAALFTILRALIKPGPAYSYGIGTWIGIILALAMAYAAYVRFQESQMGSPPAPPPA